MTNQIFLHPTEVVFTPGLQQCQFDIAKLRVHIPGKLSRIKGMNCGLYHNIKSAFNRVYILFPVNGWGCQYTASSVVEIMHGEGTPYSSSLNGQLLCSSCHASQ
ncbi:Uncharacterised protein [Escherichia coli]|nr:Uncharacterised protein [Escherichia coli]